MNYSLKDYDSDQKNLGGQLGIEVIRLDVNGRYRDMGYSIQYRWYNDFEAIHHAFFNIPLKIDNHNLQIGIHQVPFGILPYGSHSFWFSTTYYLGFEDDYDTGVKYLGSNDNWQWQVAFYKNAEYTDDKRLGRYSFDVVRSEKQQNIEVNQGNIHLSRFITLNNKSSLSAGFSAEVGQLYNYSTKDFGNRWASAAFIDLNINLWNIQIQAINYEFRPENDPLVSDETIQLGAFLYPFLVSSKANVFTANIARTFTPKNVWFEKLKLYNDWSAVFPLENGHESIQNVTGILLTRGGLYTHIDVIQGYNMWYSGGPGVALENDAAEWYSRLNINMGYYF